jgi:hypothetical protein
VRRHGRMRASSEWSTVPDQFAEFVVDEPRLTLFDADGRRIDKGIGYHARFISRDPVPQVKRPAPEGE